MQLSEKITKEFCVDGLPLIGRGANGSIYRLDDDKIIKVYNPLTNTLDRIKKEKYVAKTAFVYDIPTAISYDVVKVDNNKYGLIYEWINASTLGQYLSNNPTKLEEYAIKMSKLLRKLHSTAFNEGVLPDARDNLHIWADIAEKSGYYSDEVIYKLRNVINNIPIDNTFIHGDFHPGNIMVKDGELLLIDMTDASVGNPIIDLLGSYQIMKLVPNRNGGAERYTGMPSDLLIKLWNIFIKEYTGIIDDNQLIEYEQKLKFYALIRSLPGITFSELIPKEIIQQLANEVSNAFLHGYDILCHSKNKSLMKTKYNL